MQKLTSEHYITIFQIIHKKIANKHASEILTFVYWYHIIMIIHARKSICIQHREHSSSKSSRNSEQIFLENI